MKKKLNKVLVLGSGALDKPESSTTLVRRHLRRCGKKEFHQCS